MSGATRWRIFTKFVLNNRWRVRPIPSTVSVCDPSHVSTGRLSCLITTSELLDRKDGGCAERIAIGRACVPAESQWRSLRRTGVCPSWTSM